jgi:hypothetical protein
MNDFEERKKWDKKELEKAMKGSEEEFLDLGKRLFFLVAEFCVRALKTFQATKNEPLNPLQINQISTKEIVAVIEQLQDPRIADLIIKKAEQDFFRLGEEKTN